MGLSESEKSFEWMDVDKLKHHPDNPRRGNIEAIRESIRAHGVTRPIVVSRKTLHVLAGNHTLKAAKAEGLARIPVVFLDGLTRVQERKILLADNRTSDLGDYDNEALAQLLQEVKDEAGLLGTAYDEAALDALLEGLTPAFEPVEDVAQLDDVEGTPHLECPKCGHTFKERDAKKTFSGSL